MITAPGRNFSVEPATVPPCNLCEEPARFVIEGKVMACFHHLAGQVAVYRGPVTVVPIMLPGAPGRR